MTTLTTLTIFGTLLMTATSLYRFRRQNDDGFNLDQVNNTHRACLSKDNKQGVCVPEGQCNEKLEIVKGGVIDPSELRAQGCIEEFDWCCVFQNNDDNNSLIITKNDLDVSVPLSTRRSCQTRDNKEGFCVKRTQCNDNFTIPRGGIIDSSELRSMGCIEEDDWCCELEKEIVSNSTTLSINTTTPITNTTSASSNFGCTVADDNSCPWCAAIYRDGGNPYTMRESGLFCGGALLGTKAILTGAGCVLAAQGSKVWVRIPGSADPNKQFAVDEMVTHPLYNSGTRYHDLGLMVLKEDVQWEGERQHGRGACLALRNSVDGTCNAIGFGENDEIALTPVTVTAGSCSNRGNVPDVACGRADGECNTMAGAPVICLANKLISDYVVAGVVRQKCIGSATLMGSILASSEWLTNSLTSIGISPRNYTITIR